MEAPTFVRLDSDYLAPWNNLLLEEKSPTEEKIVQGKVVGPKVAELVERI